MNHHLRVNGNRMLADLEQLSQIGGTAQKGVHRPAPSEADLATRQWLENKARPAGLGVTQDSIGNMLMTLLATSPNASTLVFGSHLDSVPNGGRFDGALGVFSALEVLRTIKEAGLTLPCHLEGVSFTDEEGILSGLFGSRAFAGALTQDEVERLQKDPALRERLAAAGSLGVMAWRGGETCEPSKPGWRRILSKVLVSKRAVFRSGWSPTLMG